jgi:hypothetical protein
MFFHLISSDYKDETTSLKLKAVDYCLWPQSYHPTILVKRTINQYTYLHHKPLYKHTITIFPQYWRCSDALLLSLHLSSSSCTASSIGKVCLLRSYTNTKSLTYSIIHWLYFPLTHSVNYTECERHNRIVLFAFRSKFVQSSIEILVGAVPRSTVTHWSLSTKISSILSFHRSKLFPLNFLSLFLNFLPFLFTTKNDIANLPL